MPQRHLAIVLVVVGTIAATAFVYMGTLAVCILGVVFKGGTPSPELISNFKDAGLVSIGSLTTLLARTSTGDVPASVQIDQPSSKPIPTQETETPETHADPTHP